MNAASAKWPLTWILHLNNLQCFLFWPIFMLTEPLSWVGWTRAAKLYYHEISSTPTQPPEEAFQKIIFLCWKSHFLCCKSHFSNYEFAAFLVGRKLQMWCRFAAQFQPLSLQKVWGQTGTGLEGGNVRLDWAGKIIQLWVTKLLKWSCNHFYRSYTWPCLFLLQLRLLDATLEDLSTLFSVCLWIQFRN